MKKCDFCPKWNPEKKKCYWRLPSNRHSDCEMAIKKMIETLKGVR